MRVGWFVSPAPGVCLIFKQIPCKVEVLSLGGNLGLSMISPPSSPFSPLSSHSALLDNDQSNNPVLMLLLSIMSTKVNSLTFKSLVQTEIIWTHIFPLNFIFVYDALYSRYYLLFIPGCTFNIVLYDMNISKIQTKNYRSRWENPDLEHFNVKLLFTLLKREMWFWWGGGVSK